MFDLFSNTFEIFLLQHLHFISFFAAALRLAEAFLTASIKAFGTMGTAATPPTDETEP